MDGSGLLDKVGVCFWSIPFTMIYIIYMICMALQGGDLGKKNISHFLYQGNLINFDANRYEFGPVYGLLGITISNLPPMQGNNQ